MREHMPYVPIPANQIVLRYLADVELNPNDPIVQKHSNRFVTLGHEWPEVLVRCLQAQTIVRVIRLYERMEEV